jgi:hypothetical protein
MGLLRLQSIKFMKKVQEKCPELHQDGKLQAW